MENEKPATARQPIWIPILHVVQVFLSVIILGLSGWLIHGKYFDTLGYDIFTCLLTWIVVAYLLITAFISSLHKLSHPFIIIAANSVLVIFWLAAMGATAHLRSRFKYDVNIYGCYDDGSSIDSTTCLVGRDGLQKRAAVATKTGLAVMSSIAGLSALVMLLFIATLVHAVMAWYKSRSKTSSVAQTPQKQEQQGEGYQMAAPQQQYAPGPQQQQQQQVQYAPPPQPYSSAPQQAYAPPSQQMYSPPPQQTYSPPPQVFTPPPQGYQQQQYGGGQAGHQQYGQSNVSVSPQAGHSELYVQPHQQSELPAQR